MDIKSERFRKIKLILRLFKLIRLLKNKIIFIFVFAIVSSLLGLVPIYIMRPLTDNVLAPAKPVSFDDRIWLLNELIILLVIVHLLETIISSFLQFKRDELSTKIGVSLRKTLYLHLQRLTLKFYNSEKTGDLHARVCSDTSSLQYFVTIDFIDFFIDILNFIVIGIVLFSLNHTLTLLLLFPIPVILYLSHTFGEKLIASYRRLYQKSSDMSSAVFNSIKGIVVVKTSVAESREIARFDIVDANVSNERLNKAKLFFLFVPAMSSILFISGIMIRWYGGWQIITGGLSLGSLMIFIGFMWQFLSPIRELNTIYARFQDVVAAAERFFKTLDAEPESYASRDTITLSHLKGNIKFENVIFSYDGKNNVLNDINLEVQPGEIVGIVGPSGAGKSSLLQLLCRLYEPDSGSIFIDGHEIRKLDLNFLREQIGIVLQDTFLFSGTIAENIAYTKPDASKLEIIAAAKAAGAHDFIMHSPDAYDTLLREGGVGLSGGERQRISIARVLLKNSKIVIFDEATSAVDLLTQDIIRITIKKLKEEGRTIFVISHQLSMFEITDRMFFLDKGRLVEQGTYESLSKAGGALANFLKEKELAQEKERSLDFYVL